MTFQQVGWSNLSGIDYKKLETMASNDDATRKLSKLDPRGIIAIKTEDINYTYSIGQPTTDTNLGTVGGVELWDSYLSPYIERGRVIAVNLFIYAVDCIPSAGNYPEPLFTLYVDGESRESDGMFWVSNITPGEDKAGSVRFRALFCGPTTLGSGEHGFRMKVRNRGGGQIVLKSGGASGTPKAKFWIEDLGSNRLWRPHTYA